MHIALPSAASSWATVSVYSPSDPDPSVPGAWKVFTNEIIRVKLDVSGVVERLAHHYSRPYPGPLALSWTASTAKSTDNMVQPTSANDNGHFYTAQNAGTTEATEPIWPTNGGTVTDGTVVWRDSGSRNQYYWTPRASVNKDGTKILFNSTYGLHYKGVTVATQYTDTYLLVP